MALPMVEEKPKHFLQKHDELKVFNCNNALEDEMIKIKLLKQKLND